MNFEVHFDYAKGLDVENHDGYKIITLFDPDTKDTMAIYTLHLSDVELPTTLKEKSKLIKVPAKTLACHSTTQVGALPLLDLTNALVGATGLQNIYNPEIRNRIDEGKIKEVGSGMQKNPEQILAIRPDIYLQDFSAANEKDEDLERAGISFVLYNEWKEQDLLGRAEWMKLIGMLFCKNEMTDSLFVNIEKSYNHAKAAIDDSSTTIPIMYGQDYKGIWYVPGEFSYPTNMFKDAKLSFDYVKGKVSSEPKGFEAIFTNHRHAKYWFCMTMGNIKTLDDFIAQNERYKQFDAVKEGKVFSNNKRQNQFGGNDFWESGLYRPDLLLKDLIKLTRPNLLPDYETVYWGELTREK